MTDASANPKPQTVLKPKPVAAGTIHDDTITPIRPAESTSVSNSVISLSRSHSMLPLVRPLVTSLLLASRSSTTSHRLFMSSITPEEATVFTKPIVQYLFVRRDLDWPQGAVAAQAAHASVAAIVEGTAAEDAATLQYTAPEQLTSMTKAVYGVDNEEELKSIQAAWEAKFGPESYHLWVEQPENIPTALATWPVERTNAVSKLIKKLKVSYL